MISPKALPGPAQSPTTEVADVPVAPSPSTGGTATAGGQRELHPLEGNNDCMEMYSACSPRLVGSERRRRTQGQTHFSCSPVVGTFDVLPHSIWRRALVQFSPLSLVTQTVYISTQLSCPSRGCSSLGVPGLDASDPAWAVRSMTLPTSACVGSLGSSAFSPEFGRCGHAIKRNAKQAEARNICTPFGGDVWGTISSGSRLRWSSQLVRARRSCSNRKHRSEERVAREKR
jgi:hypothetical protein